MVAKKSSTLTQLKKEGLKIKQKKKFQLFLLDYGNLRVLQGYAKYLKDDHNQFLEKTSTKDLMKFVKLDMDLGLEILKELLLFEQKLNAVMINTLFAKCELDYNHILRLDTDRFLIFKDSEQYKRCYENLYARVSSSNFCQGYNFKSPYEVPLMILSLSWTFYDTILFYEILVPELQQAISSNMGYKNLSVSDLIEISHIIRKIRNTISHNDFLILYRSKMSKELADYFGLSQPNVNINNICLMIDTLNNSHQKLSKKVIKMIKKQHFRLVLRRRIGNLLGIDLVKLNAED